MRREGNNTLQFETNGGDSAMSSAREAALNAVLQIISISRNDQKPVFDAILENASKLCNAPLSFLSLVDDARSVVRIPACRGARTEFAEILKHFAEPITRSDLIAVSPIVNGEIVRLKDIADDDLYRNRDPRRVQMVEVEGVRSAVAVPMLRGDEAIGAIILYRREVNPFSEDDVSVLQSFAAQAVIAVENARQFRELSTRVERDAATRQVLHLIGQNRSDDIPVFKAILENAQRLCGAPFGNLNMLSEDGTRLEIVADGIEVFEPFRPGWSWPISSQLLVARSVRECTVLQLEDAALDRLYRDGDKDRVTVVEAGVRSVLTVPLVSHGAGIGSIGLYRREKRPFKPDEIELVQTFAEQAVIAIENARQFQALEDRTREVQELNTSLEARVKAQVGEIERMGRLKRFLPAAVADTVISQGSDQLLSSHRALLGVLFCDIRGFTAFCETAEPEETIEVLQSYHEQMGKLIADHGAGVDHRMGDGIMVLFNDPLPCDDPAGSAVQLAIAMRARMVELCRSWKRLGYRLGFGVGISLGYATVGMVGYEDRYDYTASGTAVNLAARLSDLAEDGEILLSPRAYTAVEDDFAAEQKGEMRLKGIREPVLVYRLEGEAVAQ